MLKVLTLFTAFVGIAAIAAGLLSLVKPAHSTEVTVPTTMQCYSGDYTVMESAFLNNHNEVPILQGVMDTNSLMYIFRNKVTDKWSFVYLGINNVYCLVFYGDGLVLIHSKRAANEQTY